MNTPPRARSTRAEAPPTPRHGARFDSPPPTSRKSRGPSSSSSFSTATLSPPPSSPLGPESSSSFETRKHRKRRASVLDEPVEKPVEVESEGWKELEKMFGKDFGRGPTLMNPAGRGLPTPSKTPARKKKHLSIESLGGSARRLFGSSSFTPAASKKNVLGSMPSKSRKKGIGRLGLLGEDEEDDGGSIDIFTDSNAQIPKFDPSPDNPFITRPGDAKKKRQERKGKKPEKTNKLGDDGRRDDGMVYIFRGKKMFRKFSEMNEADDPLPKKLPKTVPRPLPAFFGKEEEEEEEDEEKNVIEAKVKEAKVKEAKEEDEEEEEFDEEEDEEVMRILNKRSTFRPRLLFPSKEVEEDEPSEEEEEEEEVETDVEEVVKIEETTSTTVSIKKISRSAISRLTPDSDDDFPSDRSGRRVKFEDDDVFNRESTLKSTRKRRSMFDEKITSVFDEEESSVFDKKRSTSHKKSSIFDKKRSSFFDEEVEEPIESLLGKDTEKGGAVKEKRKRARGGSFDAPGLHTPRKEKKTRGTIA